LSTKRDLKRNAPAVAVVEVLAVAVVVTAAAEAATVAAVVDAAVTAVVAADAAVTVAAQIAATAATAGNQPDQARSTRFWLGNTRSGSGHSSQCR
jgi:hypothetical protein